MWSRETAGAENSRRLEREIWMSRQCCSVEMRAKLARTAVEASSSCEVEAPVHPIPVSAWPASQTGPDKGSCYSRRYRWTWETMTGRLGPAASLIGRTSQRPCILAGLAQAPTSLPSIACLPPRYGVISGYLMLCAGTWISMFPFQDLSVPLSHSFTYLSIARRQLK